MTLDIAYFSHTGGREANQDSVGYTQAGSAFCLAAADGVGGYRHGEYASALAVRCMKEFFRRQPQADERVLRRHMQETAQYVADVIAANPTLKDMRTTLCAAYLDGSRIVAGHIGDSRIYWFREGVLRYASQDHSLVMRLVQEGRLSPEQLRGHPRRNVITSAIGREMPLRLDVVSLAAAPGRGDGLLLCTDGFWELMLEEEMLSCLQTAENAGRWLQEMEGRLNGRLGAHSDNYTCLAAVRR